MADQSRDPANDDTMTGLFREVLRKFTQTHDDLLPAQIVNYDRTNNRATVQILIQLVDVNGNRLNRAQLSGIPVLLLGGGDFFMSWNLPPGSLGWIKANDRDTSLFLETYTARQPNTRRMHTFEDAVFIPDLMTSYTIAEEDAQAVTIQNRTGNVRISLNSQRVKITAPDIEIVGPTKITGQTTIDGNVSTTGTLENNGVNVGSTHTHAQGNDSDNNRQEDTDPPQ